MVSADNCPFSFSKQNLLLTRPKAAICFASWSSHPCKLDSLMEANAKNLDRFLTVKLNILNKRQQLGLRHADRWKRVPVFPSCALHQELANCFHLAQCLCCAEEEVEPHSLCLGAPQGCAGSTTPSAVPEQNMGLIPGTLWLWVCCRTHLPGMFLLAGSSFLALGRNDISCNCCYL